MSYFNLMMRHRVQDYDKWRPIFDGDIGRQEAAGLTNPLVVQSNDDPLVVLIHWHVEDKKRAQDFVSSPVLKEKMKEAGVVGEPDVFFHQFPGDRKK